MYSDKSSGYLSLCLVCLTKNLCENGRDDDGIMRWFIDVPLGRIEFVRQSCFGAFPSFFFYNVFL